MGQNPEYQTIQAPQKFLVSTSLGQFRDWLESYLHAHQYLNLGASLTQLNLPNEGLVIEYLAPTKHTMRLLISHKDAERLEIAVQALHVSSDSFTEVELHLKEITDAIAQRWSSPQTTQPANTSQLNSKTLAVFGNLVNAFEAQQFGTADSVYLQGLMQRTEQAIKAAFGNNSEYLDELKKIRFSFPKAKRANKIKYFNSSKTRITTLISTIMERLQIAEEIGDLNLKPIFRTLPTEAMKWSQIFVMMPFSPALKPVYTDHIKPITAKLGFTCSRADDFFTTKSVIDEVWSAIYYCRLCIADCTGKNPNVFYELGLAHTLGRDCVLISQSIDDVPFDVRHLRVIIYDKYNLQKLEADLARTLQTTFNLPEIQILEAEKSLPPSDVSNTTEHPLTSSIKPVQYQQVNLKLANNFVVSERRKQISVIKFTSDGKRLIVGMNQDTVGILDTTDSDWRLATPRTSELRANGSSWPMNSIAVSPDGKLIASPTFDTEIQIWQARELKPERRIQTVNQRATHLDFSYDGRWLVAALDDNGGLCSYFLEDNFRRVESFVGREKHVTALRFHPKKLGFFTASRDGEIKYWEIPFTPKSWRWPFQWLPKLNATPSANARKRHRQQKQTGWLPLQFT